MNRHPMYLASIVDPPKLSKIVDWFERELKKPEYAGVNGIAGRGLSGTALIGALSYKLQIAPIFIRKEPSPHDAHLLVTNGDDRFGSMNTGRYIVVDDLIATGETMREIVRQVELEKLYINPLPQAIFLYCGNDNPFYYNNKQIPIVHCDLATIKENNAYASPRYSAIYAG